MSWNKKSYDKAKELGQMEPHSLFVQDDYAR